MDRVHKPFFKEGVEREDQWLELRKTGLNASIFYSVVTNFYAWSPGWPLGHFNLVLKFDIEFNTLILSYSYEANEIVFVSPLWLFYCRRQEEPTILISRLLLRVRCMYVASLD